MPSSCVFVCLVANVVKLLWFTNSSWLVGHALDVMVVAGVLVYKLIDESRREIDVAYFIADMYPFIMKIMTGYIMLYNVVLLWTSPQTCSLINWLAIGFAYVVIGGPRGKLWAWFKVERRVWSGKPVSA